MNCGYLTERWYSRVVIDVREKSRRMGGDDVTQWRRASGPARVRGEFRGCGVVSYA